MSVPVADCASHSLPLVLRSYEDALSIMRHNLGPDHISLALSLNSIGAVHYNLGRHKEALVMYEDALRIWRVALGSDHIDVATSLTKIGAVYSQVCVCLSVLGVGWVDLLVSVAWSSVQLPHAFEQVECYLTPCI